MVVTRLEERVEALHPLPADDGVTDRELERVPHVQLAGHVRRRVRVDVRLARRIGIRLVEALSLPGLLPALLDALRLVQRLHPAILGAELLPLILALALPPTGNGAT